MEGGGKVKEMGKLRGITGNHALALFKKKHVCGRVYFFFLFTFYFFPPHIFTPEVTLFSLIFIISIN